MVVAQNNSESARISVGDQQRVALLGGSFDPIHFGHLHIAEVVLATGDYDQVLLVPANVPSHKPGVSLASAPHRLAMLRLATAEHSGLSVSDVELCRGGISYTIDTVRQLQNDGMINTRPGLVVGDDLSSELNTWREAAVLFKMVELLVARRAKKQDTVPFPHRRLLNHWLPLSSSNLRWRVRNGHAIRKLLPDCVETYIRDNRLYDTKIHLS